MIPSFFFGIPRPGVPMENDYHNKIDLWLLIGSFSKSALSLNSE